MSTHRKMALLVSLGIGAAIATAGAEGPGLGRAVSPAELAAWDISISPDGANLPPGRGTPAQGERLYAERCVACHGERGVGQPNDRLVGGQGSLAGSGPAVRTVGSFWPYAPVLFDYVRRAMPMATPKSLSDDETYALTAYLLQLNGIIGADDQMDARSLAAVRMPNRDGFTTWTRSR